MTPAKAKLYFRLLEDLDIEVLRLALAAAAKTCKVFPTPAHIREHAERIAVELPPPEASLVRQAHEDCAICDGTGFEHFQRSVAMGDELGTVRMVDAVRSCRCRTVAELPTASRREQVAAPDHELLGELRQAADGRAL